MVEAIVTAGLREIVVARDALNSLEARLVVRARLSGCTWSELAEPLGLSKQAVRKRHLGIDPLFAQQSTKPPTIAEYHAEMLRAMGGRIRS